MKFLIPLLFVSSMAGATATVELFSPITDFGTPLEQVGPRLQDPEIIIVVTLPVDKNVGLLKYGFLTNPGDKLQD